MRKAVRLGIFIVQWLRREVGAQDTLGQAIIVVTFTLICLRIIFPVWHLWDGHIVYLYPLHDSAICLSKLADCQVDRSRTFMESSALGLAALGLIYVRHARKNRKR